jgi:hypothetical protein
MGQLKRRVSSVARTVVGQRIESESARETAGSAGWWAARNEF